MSSLVADTHAVVWFLSGSARLSGRAKASMEAAIILDMIFVPTMSIVELTYLTEKDRIEKDALAGILAALRNPASRLIDMPMNLAIAVAVSRIPRALVPDLPDRVTAATALALGLPLVTADRQIRSCGIETIW